MVKVSLWLNIEQGPKAGSRVYCKPASVTTIGRARANALQIGKDAGISQKHVCFQWRNDAEHAGWMAMDMDSSNGTIINNRHAAPQEWICLQNGDLIKIGAETTIRAEIAETSEDDSQVALPKMRERSKRRTSAVAESHGMAMADRENSGKVASTLSKSKLEIQSSNSMPADIDLSMTVEQWFEHMMEEGPKYLYKVSEAMIQDILLESKQFDEYVMSLG